MRVILTEEQLKLVRLIKENTEFSEMINSRVEEVKKNADGLYNIITFTTIAEIRDGETDISVMEQKVKNLDSILMNLSRKVSDYFKRYDEDTYFAKKLDEVEGDLEDRIRTVDKKIMALDRIVTQLKPFAKVNEYGEGREKDWDEPFNNISPIKL